MLFIWTICIFMLIKLYTFYGLIFKYVQFPFMISWLLWSWCYCNDCLYCNSFTDFYLFHCCNLVNTHYCFSLYSSVVFICCIHLLYSSVSFSEHIHINSQLWFMFHSFIVFIVLLHYASLCSFPIHSHVRHWRILIIFKLRQDTIVSVLILSLCYYMQDIFIIALM